MAFLKRFYLVAVLGIITSTYLVFHHVEVVGGYSNTPSFCNINAAFDCDTVAKSSYSQFFGIPVASFGLFYYLIITLLLFLISKKEGPEHTAYPMLFLATVSLPFTIALFSISEFIIGKLCIICCVTYFINLVLFLISYFNPLRKESFFTSLGYGFKDTVSTFFSLKYYNPVVPLATILLGIISILLPIKLEQFYFIPKKIELNSDRFLKPIITEWANSKEFEIPLYLESSTLRDYILGGFDAPYTLVEFSDYECPMCKRAAPIVKSLIEESGGEIRFLSRAFPLSSKCNPNVSSARHENSCLASESVRCAGEQGEAFYWKYHEKLFSSASLSPIKIGEIAREIGLNQAYFDKCLAEGGSKDKIEKDLEIANFLMVDSTPTFFLNGKLLKVRAEILPIVINRIIAEEKLLDQKR